MRTTMLTLTLLVAATAGWPEGAPASAEGNTVLLVDGAATLAPDRALVERALLNAWRACHGKADGWLVEATDQEPTVVASLTAGGPLAADVLGALGLAASQPRLSAAFGLARTSVLSSGKPAMLVIVSGGLVQGEDSSREAELRQQAAEAEKLVAAGARSVVLGFVVAGHEAESHWGLHRLAERLGGEAVVVRSGSEKDLAPAVAAIERAMGLVLPAASANKNRAQRPLDVALWLGVFLLAMTGVGILYVLAAAALAFFRWRRQRPTQPVVSGSGLSGDDLPETELEPELLAALPDLFELTVADRQLSGRGRPMRLTFVVADVRDAGALTVGSDASAFAVLRGAVAPEHLRLRVDRDDQLWLEVPSDVQATVDGRQVHGLWRELAGIRRRVEMGEAVDGRPRFELTLQRMLG